MSSTRSRTADFTEARYTEIVRDAKSFYRFKTFDEPCEQPHVLWCHDIDYSVHRAMRLAEIEAEEGVTATYFFLLHSPFYNLLEPDSPSSLARSSLCATMPGCTSTPRITMSVAANGAGGERPGSRPSWRTCRTSVASSETDSG